MPQDDDKPIHVDSVPCIIRELTYAPPSPQNITKLLEVALTYHNTSHYHLAIQSYLTAEERWKDCNRDKKLTADENVFFHIAIGSVHESEGQDELALEEYMEAEKLMDMMEDEHPNHAIVYSSIGGVYVHLSVFDFAMNYFQHALELRLQYLPSNHVDIGLSYNNVGVCYHCLNKVAESLEYYNKALNILSNTFDSEHPRVVATRSNLNKVKSKMLQDFTFTIPKFEPIIIPVIGKAATKGKKKKKKKGKKRKKKKK
mgnify:CR=1 FL=1